jgi:membrane-bound lytic murein transglycosylase D
MKFYKKIIIYLLLPTLAYSNLRDEFPSYNYIFTEFNVNENFIDNPEFRQFVNENKVEYRGRFIKAVKRGGLIVPLMKEVMNQREISPLFLYISMVESEFDTKARSRTGAAGLWQFVVNTGKELKLNIDRDVDERYDPVRSTHAAIKYLYRINNNLDRWYLTTMAYNCGNGCVNKAIKRAGTRDLGVLISSRNSYIKKETKKYIQKVLLMAMIGENYLFKRDDRVGELMYGVNSDSITPVTVRSGERLSRLASILNMNTFYLKKINPHLKREEAPMRRGYKINIPRSKLPLFNRRYAQYPAIKREYFSRNNY